MKKVLIIDDAKDSRLILKKLLSRYEFLILEANDGLEGWKTIIKEKPDLVLLDIHMPIKDGFEILRDLEEEWMEVPVVVVSCDSTQNTISTCQLNGATKFLQKPIKTNELNDVIRAMSA